MSFLEQKIVTGLKKSFWHHIISRKFNNHFIIVRVAVDLGSIPLGTLGLRLGTHPGQDASTPQGMILFEIVSDKSPVVKIGRSCACLVVQSTKS